MQVIDSLLVGEYEVILPGDPALEQPDPKAPDAKKALEAFAERYRLYWQTKDVSHLPIRAGQEPVRWKLQHITGRVRHYLIGKVQSTARDRALSPLVTFILVQHALVGATPATIPTGGDFEFVRQPCPETKAFILAEEVVDKIDASLPYDVLDELGAKVVEALFASPLS